MSAKVSFFHVIICVSISHPYKHLGITSMSYILTNHCYLREKLVGLSVLKVKQQISMLVTEWVAISLCFSFNIGSEKNLVMKIFWVRIEFEFEKNFGPH